MSEIIIILSWLGIACWLISRWTFFIESGLPMRWLLALYMLKLAAAGAYYWFFTQPAYQATSDTWRYYHISLKETNWLLSDPAGFLRDLFSSGYDKPSGLFSSSDSYWNDLKDNVFIKLLAICNLLTNRSYFANTIIFNLFYFAGPVMLYRIIHDKNVLKQLPAIAVIFLIPSFIFWQSGLHKDGLIFTCLMSIIYTFYQWIEKKTDSPFKQLFLLLIAFLLLFSFRNYLLMLLLPALVCWWLVFRYGQNGIWLTVALYMFGLIIIFAGGYLHPDLNFAQYIVNRHNEFLALDGGSQLSLPMLESNLNSFLAYLPYAFDIALLRPHFTEIANASYWPAIAENTMIVLIIAGSFLPVKKQLFLNSGSGSTKAFMTFLLCFAGSFLLLAGYTITLTGAIVRYRSLALPFLLLFILLFAKPRQSDQLIDSRINNN